MLLFTYVWFTGCDRRAVYTRFEVVHVIFVHTYVWQAERVLSCDSRKNKSNNGSDYYALERVRVESFFDVDWGGLSRAYDKLRVCSACTTCDIHMSKYGGTWQEVEERELFGGGMGHTHKTKKIYKQSFENFHNFIAFLINAACLWRTYRTHLGNYYEKYP